MKRNILPRAILVAALSLAAPFAAGQNSTIESLTGPVTPNEIASFKAAIAGIVPGSSNSGNNYAYGNSGDAMEACGDMYDVTKDRAILDKLIQYCDKVVSIRNTTKVMWTGDIDPVWQNDASNTQWGCEQGDVAGHLAYCAQLVAKRPALWEENVKRDDPEGYGRTYRQRATRYLQVVDETMDLFYRHGFIRDDEKMITPEAPKWPDPRSAGKAVPWNQQNMICSALIQGAQAHALFGGSSERVAKYRKTATASVQRFLAQCEQFKYSRNGRTVCKWSYSGGEFPAGAPIRYTEDTAHGGYDITLLWRCFNYLPGAVSPDQATMVADTLMEVIAFGGQFHSRVDGTGPLKNGMKNSWAYLSQWRPDAFAALVKPGKVYYADAARYLWIKQARHIGWSKATAVDRTRSLAER